MGLLWTTKADDWMVKPASFSAVAGKTGFHGRFRMGIYSPRTGFLGDVGLNGSAAGLGANISFDTSDSWLDLDLSTSFSPEDLHGAPGSLKFGGWGAIIGGTAIFGSARLKGSKNYLFEDAQLHESGVNFGMGAGYIRGQWKLDNVWSQAGNPGSSQAKATESVGSG
jgi:hypothetical protein